ncbi:DoxX family protein [Streptomyces adelaidensis]|uniref:DoxX family protein n=1 Tax=Streptomyces adelaidensis TaxID=2796465 RepID=UPI001905549A|nr:DoxX family protein [Streptomyces adelaidensis]
MNAAIVLTALVAVFFAGLGVTKILALPPMRALAAEVGFSVAAYRGLGVLEVAAAVGVALGPVVPLFGGLAATGLLLLLAGAVVTHVRKGDGPRKYSAALVCAAFVAAYLMALFG